MNLAVDLVGVLASGRKAAQLYPQTHPAFMTAIDAVVAAVSRAIVDTPVTLNLHQGHLYHESTMVSDDTHGVASIIEAFEQRKIESLSLHPGFDSKDAIALVEVLGLRPSPDLDIENELVVRGATRVNLAFLAGEGDLGQVERNMIRERNLELRSRMVAQLSSANASFASHTMPDVSELDRTVADVTARLLENTAATLAIAAAGGGNANLMHHSVNVMIYSLALGAALGLPEEGLSSLGVSALLHDVGKSDMKVDDPSQLRAMYLLHPQVGADILSRKSEKDPTLMLVAFEHHMSVDGGGFPARDANYITHPFSRIVAIANRYANLTGGSSETPQLTPDRAIQVILAESGTLFDPLFVRLFAKAMGVFPIGCVVRLSDHSVGIVSETGADSLRPVVRVIYDSRGLKLQEPVETALAEGAVTIVEVVDPESLALTVGDHL
ncbi:MAG: HD domain-containing protein [Actinobacteria bacterium]|nr:HD domain-containing protein [Actinomycetota bacterium]MCL5888190.1 HD domain-containing protein [Actinomycetota bacterium]